MNYRHAFHAGNFADVVKHAILSRIVGHLLNKESPFRVIDTHAGAGLYDLTGPEAVRNPEWRAGIGRLLDAIDRSGRASLAARLSRRGALRQSRRKDHPLSRLAGARALVAAARATGWSPANSSRPPPKPCHTTFAATGA